MTPLTSDASSTDRWRDPKFNVPVIIRHDKIRCNTPTFALEHHMTTSF